MAVKAVLLPQTWFGSVSSATCLGSSRIGIHGYWQWCCSDSIIGWYIRAADETALQGSEEAANARRDATTAREETARVRNALQDAEVDLERAYVAAMRPARKSGGPPVRPSDPIMLVLAWGHVLQSQVLLNRAQSTSHTLELNRQGHGSLQ